MQSGYTGPLTAKDAKRLSMRVKNHRKEVADKILTNIYKAISSRARYGERVISYTFPEVTNTVYDVDAVMECVQTTLRTRNFRVSRKGNCIYVGWG